MKVNFYEFFKTRDFLFLRKMEKNLLKNGENAKPLGPLPTLFRCDSILRDSLKIDVTILQRYMGFDRFFISLGNKLQTYIQHIYIQIKPYICVTVNSQNQ